MNTAAPANAPAATPAPASEPEYVGQIEHFSDPATPEAPPAPQEPAAVNGRGEDDGHDAAPKFFGDDKRAAFYERQRARARGEQVDAPADAVDPTAPFASKEGEEDHDDSLDEIVRQAREANGEIPQQQPGSPQPQRAQDTPKTYELKVNRNTFTATREQLLQMAGLSEEEAAGVPESVLVRSAQIAEAARQRLIEAKGAPSSEPADRQAQPPHPAEGNGHNADGTNTNAQQGLSALSEAELVRRIQYGDEEEAAAALRESNRRALAEASQAHRFAQTRQTVEQALANFEKANPDIVQNDVAMELFTAAAVADVRSLLIHAGADPQTVRSLSPEEATAVYSKAVAQGVALPPVDDLLARAEAKTRELARLPKSGSPTPTPRQAQAPQSQPSAIERRTAAKANLAQTPQRAGNPAPTTPTPAPGNKSRESVLNWMRQTRGQKPLH